MVLCKEITDDDVARPVDPEVVSNRQAFAKSERARGDALLAPIRGVDNTSQVRAAGDIAIAGGKIANDVAAATAPLSVKEREAAIGKINAEADATRAGAGTVKTVQGQADEANKLHDQDRRAWLTERQQMQTQLQQLQTKYQQVGAAQQQTANQFSAYAGNQPQPATQPAHAPATPDDIPADFSQRMAAKGRGYMGSERCFESTLERQISREQRVVKLLRTGATIEEIIHREKATRQQIIAIRRAYPSYYGATI